MPQEELASLNALVVDDHTSFRSKLVKQLKALGFVNVDEALDADEATEKLKRRNKKKAFYHMLFLDLHMPGESGWDVLNKCKEDPVFTSLAVIIVSSEGGKSIPHAEELGAAAYLVKPYKEDVLAAAIVKARAWIEQHPSPADPWEPN
jgi:CheY-like chemotaxis protein